MQFLNDFFETINENTVVSAAQGSAFAKQVAGDFNPIHDPGYKRFCVPGDLLFAIALYKYGLHQTMSFEFLDMVKADSLLVYPHTLGKAKAHVRHASLSAAGESGGKAKQALAIEAAGAFIHDSALIESVLRKYVAFSGRNFPHILMPLMKEHGVMINPARPLVIYQSMSFELDSLQFTTDLEIKLTSTRLEVEGKRGDAVLNFTFYDGNLEIGRGAKKLVLSGLRPHDAQTMQALCDDYLANAKLVD